MGSPGIKDKVAIVGMGCTAFGEHWDKSVDDMLIDAAQEAYASAGVAHQNTYFWATIATAALLSPNV